MRRSTAAPEKRILLRAAKVGIGLSPEPQSLVLELLRNIRADVARVEDNLQSEIRSLRADVAADLVVVNARIDVGRKETSEQIAGLRRAVVEYHSAVLGHGMLISELEARVRRIEQRLSLPEMDAN
jgi:chromosome segregation ATPase